MVYCKNDKLITSSSSKKNEFHSSTNNSSSIKGFFPQHFITESKMIVQKLQLLRDVSVVYSIKSSMISGPEKNQA
jgi:hypothetical protein